MAKHRHCPLTVKLCYRNWDFFFCWRTWKKERFSDSFIWHVIRVIAPWASILYVKGNNFSCGESGWSILFYISKNVLSILFEAHFEILQIQYFLLIGISKVSMYLLFIAMSRGLKINTVWGFWSNSRGNHPLVFRDTWLCIWQRDSDSHRKLLLLMVHLRWKLSTVQPGRGRKLEIVPDGPQRPGRYHSNRTILHRTIFDHGKKVSIRSDTLKS